MPETLGSEVEGAADFKMPDDESEEVLETSGKITDLLPKLAEKLKLFGATEDSLKKTLIGRIRNSYDGGAPKVGDPFLDSAIFRDLNIDAESGRVTFHLVYQFRYKDNNRTCELNFMKINHNGQEVRTPFWSVHTPMKKT